MRAGTGVLAVASDPLASVPKVPSPQHTTLPPARIAQADKNVDWTATAPDTFITCVGVPTGVLLMKWSVPSPMAAPPQQKMRPSFSDAQVWRYPGDTVTTSEWQ